MPFCKFKKADEELQLVYAEVYAPLLPDSDGDFMTADEIRKMAHKFLKSGNTQNVDVNHDNEHHEAHVVESFIARKGDGDFIPDAWVVAIKIDDDDLWEAIKSGELNGFSMQARALRSEAELEIDMPPILKGETAEQEDHIHRFEAYYDDEGKFSGGKTDLVDGHMHVIRRGTVTEKAGEPKHSHRFSAVDGLTGIG